MSWNLIVAGGGSETDPLALKILSNLSDLNNAGTARTNLGLGSSAVVDAGTAASEMVQLDGSAKLPAVDGSQLTNLPGGSAFSTVGAGGDYATVKLAIDDGKTWLRLIANVTELADLSTGITQLWVEIDADVIWDLNTRQFTFTDTDVSFKFNGGTIRFASTVFGRAPMFPPVSGGNCRVLVENCIIDNNSTQTTTLFRTFRVDYKTYNNCEFQLPNLGSCGVGNGNLASGWTLVKGCHFVGGGATCSGVVNETDTQHVVSVVDCQFSGTFDNTLETITARASFHKARIENLHIQTRISLRVAGVVKNIVGNFRVDVDIEGIGSVCEGVDFRNEGSLLWLNGDGAVIRGCTRIATLVSGNGAEASLLVENCTIDQVSTSGGGNLEGLRMINCEIDGNFNTGLRTNPARELHLINCKFTGNVTLGIDRTVMQGCILQELLTISGDSIKTSDNQIRKDVSISGDWASMTADSVGDEAFGYGGTVTITTTGTADKAMITGCRTDAAIVDNGTNTTLTGNQVA